MTQQQLSETAGYYDEMMDRVIASDAFLIVLDEALHALKAGLLKPEKLEQVLKKDAEIVLTGASAPSDLTEKADYISEIRKVRHPYDRGVAAREGVEF